MTDSLPVCVVSEILCGVLEASKYICCGNSTNFCKEKVGSIPDSIGVLLARLTEGWGIVPTAFFFRKAIKRWDWNRVETLFVCTFPYMPLPSAFSLMNMMSTRTVQALLIRLARQNRFQSESLVSIASQVSFNWESSRTQRLMKGIIAISQSL
eukprot:CAMPEP_0182448008 /NCGR_PEP_ID=MMETSP1172-20130603/22645_1 /TAXON_ID=708627 /ORGANISM="Timspurckia oligopyrenoides, Strain CCMP3278" /LENGTH=152 /DNA_ID=CAMNT_0024644699 /DNA_START=725 /DNA_END=1183 /DNA_ORIENTATION=-